MDIHKLYKPFLTYFRQRCLQVLYQHFQINASTKIVDTEGDFFFI
jgi:hypothetical protein